MDVLALTKLGRNTICCVEYDSYEERIFGMHSKHVHGNVKRQTLTGNSLTRLPVYRKNPQQYIKVLCVACNR